MLSCKGTASKRICRGKELSMNELMEVIVYMYINAFTLHVHITRAMLFGLFSGLYLQDSDS